MRWRPLVRWGVRVCILAAAVFLALGGPVIPFAEKILPSWAGRILPALSPLVAFNGILAQRGWYLGIFWVLPPVMILGLAVWRGRWFCRWACPTGTSYAMAAKLSWPRTRLRILRWPIAPVLFYTIVFSSILGVTQFLSLDPLSSFTRLTGRASSVAAWIPGAIIPLFLILGLFQPMLWCSHVCPLGYFFKLSHSISRQPRKVFYRDRRHILLGLLIGIPAGAILPYFLRRKNNPILPPGAREAQHFAATCIRCYACVGACPTGIIVVRMRGGLHELFAPEIDLDAGQQVCPEDCNACTQVCPSGAIAALTLKEKQHRRIALAKVKQHACIAWADNEVCMVCDEYCPYSAVDVSYSPEDKFHDVPFPQINPDRCRGCGYCRKHCISLDPDKAVEILPIEKQDQIYLDR